MWVFLSDSFLSIVAHRAKPDMLLVRARRAGDIKRAFPWVKKEQRTPAADYLYRAEISRNHLAAHIQSLAFTIDYDNFKGSVSDGPRREAYGKVWAAMMAYQQETSGLPKSSHSRPRRQPSPFAYSRKLPARRPPR